jgi:hypothetical protein
MLCGGLDAECADQAGPLADRDRERRVGAAAANQENGRIAGWIDIVERHRHRRLQPAHDSRVQRPDAKRGIEAGNQPRRHALRLEKRNRIAGRAQIRIDRDQRQIGLVLCDRLGERADAGLVDPGRGGNHRRGAQLFDGAHRVAPFALDHRKQFCLVQRGGERRASLGG